MLWPLPAWLHWYRKPSYRDPVTFSKSVSADIENGLGSRPGSISSQSDAAIPSDLTLDCVLANKTCSPLSLYDFYMYLKHIEMSPENLEFYIWFKDYEARYNEDSHPNSPSQVTPLLVTPGAEKSGPYSYSGVALEEVDQGGQDPGTVSGPAQKTTRTDIPSRFSAVHRDPGDFPGSQTMQSILATTQLRQDSDKNVLQPRRAPEHRRTVSHVTISQRAEHST